MDQERFDTITRTLAPGISRRGVVRSLGGAMLGGIMVAVGFGEAAAKNKKKKKKKRGKGKRKGRPHDPVCTPKTCAELGRWCGTAPDDGCGNPLDCASACGYGSDPTIDCCAGKCCKANGTSCNSDDHCCNGDCVKGLGFAFCHPTINYTCAP